MFSFEKIKKPNFFILGAPRCGTTSLSTYLREHPNVFFSFPKEVNFFSSDIYSSTLCSDISSYLKLFSNSEEIHLAVGEGSVFYLASNCAVPSILQFNPQAKFIVMVRNPVDMA